MCVAAIINKPVSLAYLESMHKDNPHGAGVAWLASGDTQLTFRRGLGPADILALQNSGEITYPYALHFRYATHGEKSPAMTHPFPVGVRALLGELEGKARRVLIHNGTWHNQETWLEYHGYATRGRMPQPALLARASDTAIVAWLMSIYPEIIKEVSWATALCSVENGEFRYSLTGGWQEYRGNLYSNLMWLPYREWADSAAKRGALTRSRVRWSRETWKNTWDNDSLRRADSATFDSWVKGVQSRQSKQPEPDGLPIELKSGQIVDDETNDVWDSWEDYVRAKYGDETSEAATELTAQEDDLTAIIARWEQGQEVDTVEFNPDEDIDPDFISDDPEAVNAYLARQMLG